MKKKIVLTTLSVLCIGSAAIGLAACKTNKPAEHKHTPGEWVNTDATQHYKLCTDTNCDNPGKKLYARKHDNEGTDGACSVCGYTPTVITPPEIKHNWGEWTVTEENKPTKVTPGFATRTCTDDDCFAVDREYIELPPLASKSEYTITNDNSSCTEGGTATYTYNKDNTAISFTAATDAKGHTFGEPTIVNGVPFATCGGCGQTLAAELSATINQSNDTATIFTGGGLEFTLTAQSGSFGYYIFTYTGEKQITVEYNYYSLRDGEVSGTVTLSSSGRTMITAFLEDRATCTMKITSEEETAFVGEISLEFSDTDPSYVTPELSLGLTTVNAKYEGTIYEFNAPISGSYTLSSESEKAVVVLNGEAETLNLPYTFTLEKGQTISFAMSCDDATAEYDVQVALNMQGSGTYSDPYIITEEMLAVNVNAILKNGETKYYKIAMQGNYLLNCLPLEANGSYPTFVHDSYTAETYTAEIVIEDSKKTVTGWQVPNITCGENGFVFALTGSGSNATDNVQLYVNHVYGSEANPANWLWYYFYYNSSKGFEIGDTIHIDFLARVDGRIDISTLNISSVKLNGEVLATNGDTFEMIVTKGETYSFECVISSDTSATYYIGTDVDTEITTVAPPVGTQTGTKFDKGSILLWFNHSAGTEKNPYKLDENANSFEAYANDKTYAKVGQAGNYTFTFTGLTATLNGETALVSGTQYKLIADDVIEFVNESAAAAVAVAFEANTGDITNPLLIAELQTDSFTVESGATYYVQADGDSDMVLTFNGVTVTLNDSSVTSGTKFNFKDGDIIKVVNEGSAAVTVNYTTTAVLGSVNNPKTLTVDTAQAVEEETYFSLTLTGDNKFTISVSGVTPLTVNGVNNMTMAVLPNVTYPLYSAIIEIDNNKYVFNEEGILCSYAGNNAGTNVAYDGQKSWAYVATEESKALELAAGTYIVHVIKNAGGLSVLETLSMDCTLTVTEKQAPPVTEEGSGTSADPYIVSDGTNTHTTTAEDEFEGAYIGSNIHYLTYTANGKGTLSFSISDGATFVFPSKVSYTDALTSADYVFPNDMESCSLSVDGGDVVYIIAGNAYGAGEYSFNVEFVSSENGSSEKPFTVKEGVNTHTTTDEDEFEGSYIGANIHYLTYTAKANGTLTFSETDNITFVFASKASFESAPSSTDYVFPGDAESCSLTVNAGDIIYIVAGNAYGAGEYSFDVVFTAD